MTNPKKPDIWYRLVKAQAYFSMSEERGTAGDGCVCLWQIFRVTVRF